MATLRVLDRNGDSPVSWDTRAASAGDPEALAALREAERIFERERARGSQAFRVRPAAPAERLETFDPGADETVVVPPMAGG
jgi:hypothetical protein